jgi:F0F1-type ATP synthase delta subunit
MKIIDFFEKFPKIDPETMKNYRRMAHVARRIAPMIISEGGSQECADAIFEEMGVFSKGKQLALMKALLIALRRREIYSAASVQSATAIDCEAVGKLSDKFSQKLGRPVRLVQREDRELIGGIRVTIGDQRWEMSLRRRLETIAKAHP